MRMADHREPDNHRVKRVCLIASLVCRRDVAMLRSNDHLVDVGIDESLAAHTAAMPRLRHCCDLRDYSLRRPRNAMT